MSMSNFADSAGPLGARKRRNASGFTPLECEIARLVAEGLSNREIAMTLYRSEHTVAEYIQAMRRRMGARNRAHLVALTLGHLRTPTAKPD